MTAIHDLRSYLAVLEAAGELVRIAHPVNLEHELADVAAALMRRNGPAPLFTQVGDPGWPVFCSAVANQARAALALGCQPGEVVQVMRRVLEPAAGIAPVVVEDAAWKAHVTTGAAVDATRLPIPVHARGDGGPFITGGVIIAADPVTGRGNLSYNRMQVKGPRTFGFNVNEWRHVRQFLDTQEKLAAPLPVAVAIGLDPAVMIAAGARYEGDELNIAGAIRSAGVRVSRGVTCDLLIPADAEIVIEGYLGPGERAAEGRLAEFHGYFGDLWESPVFHITAICWRDEPIFQTIIPGWDEHIYLGNVLPREPLFLKFVEHVSKHVTGLHIPPYGSGFTGIVAIAKQNPGEPRNVALAAFTAHLNLKCCIVVDPDVNIYDPADVLWALSTRVDWSQDIFLIPGAQGHEMDPTADMRGVHTKIGIDATFDKGRRDYAGRVKYAPVDLSQYLPG